MHRSAHIGQAALLKRNPAGQPLKVGWIRTAYSLVFTLIIVILIEKILYALLL